MALRIIGTFDATLHAVGTLHIIEALGAVGTRYLVRRCRHGRGFRVVIICLGERARHFVGLYSGPSARLTDIACCLYLRCLLTSCQAARAGVPQNAELYEKNCLLDVSEHAYLILR